MQKSKFSKVCSLTMILLLLMLILESFRLTEASDSTLFDQAINDHQNSAQSFPASILHFYKNYRGLFPSHHVVHPLIHADQKPKRVNFRTENLSDMERKMKKRLATNWHPELHPENENSKLDINPASTNAMTLENQMAILQHLLRMKSQGLQIPEYRMNVQLSSAHEDIKQDATIESDKIPINYHEKSKTENNVKSFTKQNNIIICKLMNFDECYKIDWNTKLFSTKPNGT